MNIVSNWKFEHDQSGYFAVMQSSEVQSMLNQYGSRVLNAANGSGHAGDDYSMQQSIDSQRAKVLIKPNSIHARRSNLKHNTLLKALGSTKG